MCQYGNCTSEDITVTVNFRGEERPAFCCGEHAALWLLRREWGYKADKDYTSAEHIVLQRIETQ